VGGPIGRLSEYLASNVTKIVAAALASVIGLFAVAVALGTTTTTVRVTHSPRYGSILEDGARYTLYVWCPGTSTRCTPGHSASSWSPLALRGQLVATSGVDRHKLATRRLSNGTHQVTYYGEPLYLYKGDHKPCQVNGEERISGNGSFFVVQTNGAPEPTPCYFGSGGTCPPPCGK
jgi:predicted lipoprotein with Yx(FWY)xxD motif